MRIYIDTITGTWGELSSLRCITIDPTTGTLEDLGEMCDFERIALALDQGAMVETTEND